jgi:Na+/H+ antiporter NhaD/arsenite permease-like protein
MTAYLDDQRFIEPMFVFVIMVIAASRPITQFTADVVHVSARAMPIQRSLALFFLSLSLVPMLGSVITEPAAMTIAALMLRDGVFAQNVSSRIKYATIAVLFVNVSIGGALTNFAAPPVLMVAAKWEWSSGFMLATFGWKVALAVIVNAALLTLLFHRELKQAAATDSAVQRPSRKSRVPGVFVAINLVLLGGVVFANHDPEVFMGLFLLFLGLAEAYKRHHDRLMIREALMVAFFLAGLVVLGGKQQWWLQELLEGMSGSTLFFGATLLTAVTDNAALTYLGSLVEGISDEFKYALVAGALAGGGLTVIANAPNPAGYAILKDRFADHSINLFGLFVAALPPTLVAVLCLWGLDAAAFEMFSLEKWQAWFAGVDRGFAFLLLLPAVVAVVGLWSSRREPVEGGKD